MRGSSGTQPSDLLGGVLGIIQCSCDAIIPTGDHVLVTAVVKATSTLASQTSLPLLYHRKAYTTVRLETSLPAAPVSVVGSAPAIPAAQEATGGSSRTAPAAVGPAARQIAARTLTHGGGGGGDTQAARRACSAELCPSGGAASSVECSCGSSGSASSTSDSRAEVPAASGSWEKQRPDEDLLRRTSPALMLRALQEQQELVHAGAQPAGAGQPQTLQELLSRQHNQLLYERKLELEQLQQHHRPDWHQQPTDKRSQPTGAFAKPVHTVRASPPATGRPVSGHRVRCATQAILPPRSHPAALLACSVALPQFPAMRATAANANALATSGKVSNGNASFLTIVSLGTSLSSSLGHYPGGRGSCARLGHANVH